MVKLVYALTALGAATSTASSAHTTTTSNTRNKLLYTDADEPSTSSSSSSCPLSSQSFHSYLDKFHGDHVCDRIAFNDMKDNLPVGKHYRYLQSSGHHLQVPTTQTVTCPLPTSTTSSSLYHPHQATGFDTTWMVENTASSAVAVAWVDPDTGLEWSARNPDLTVSEDVETILQPGQWAAIQTFEGHVFHVRQVLMDGSLGELVLQHRVGLIPIRGNGDCSEPVVSLSRRHALQDYEKDLIYEDEEDEVYDPFQRTPPQSHGRRCNRLEVGFRNMAGCPLLGYFVEPDTCEEVFKFHLGLETSTVQDFMHDWDSASKFESSFVGQTFVFRHAETNHVVDQITLLPTQIVDCPNRVQESILTRINQAIVLPTGQAMVHNSTSSAAGVNASWSAMSPVSRMTIGSVLATSAKATTTV